MCKFKLYLSGKSLVSRKTIADVTALFESRYKGKYTLDVIYVPENPDSAMRDGILATPTLMKVKPLPQRKVLGDLSMAEKVLEGLCLKAAANGV